MSKAPDNLTIAETDCPACGAVLRLKVNRNGNVYGFCTQPDPEGGKCWYRVSFGRQKSKALIEKYFEGLHTQEKNTPPETHLNAKEEQNVKTELSETIRSDDRIAGPTEQRSGSGFLAALIGALAE